MRDGTTVALPCALTPAENAALAASMTDALARTRADAADYRGDRVRVADAEEAEVASEEETRGGDRVRE
jgi:hypothetical protein